MKRGKGGLVTQKRGSWKIVVKSKVVMGLQLCSRCDPGRKGVCAKVCKYITIFKRLNKSGKERIWGKENIAVSLFCHAQLEDLLQHFLLFGTLLCFRFGLQSTCFNCLLKSFIA